jgi:hypothetical protein
MQTYAGLHRRIRTVLAPTFVTFISFAVFLGGIIQRASLISDANILCTCTNEGRRKQNFHPSPLMWYSLKQRHRFPRV